MYKLKLLIVLVLIASFSNAWSQKSNPYHLPIQQTMDAYRESVKEDPNAELIDVEKYIEGIKIDVKYATKDNFMKRVMYSEAKVFVRKNVADQLKKIQNELKDLGLGFKIFDGYRPYAVTLDFYVDTANRGFVANPRYGSKHNRGCAVDLTLIDLESGNELEMGTPFDSFLKESAAMSTQISKEARKNRDFLIDLMKKHDLNVISTEWWHFDYKDWKQYPLMDLSFEELSAG